MSVSIDSGMPHSALAASNERSLVRTGRGRRLAIALGIVTLACALRGVAYNLSTLAFVLSENDDAVVRASELTHFRVAFYVMSAVCLACHGALVVGGWRLLRGRSSPAVLLVCVWSLEVLYFALVGAAWLIPGIGLSIGAATGLANGGLMFQFAILLPLWGPFAAVWVLRQDSPGRRPG